ncbi:hypothetical protein TBLA_0B01810 [Henningerozyma blattae CBS 6284]|uniref:Stress response protein NST1 n=1 Tax=Henningerozyma blattae (strain ATCC 34711 / CBS 6284 / DSM 70876 / NBRC 10599 / NRRL Y-10934 / UCD 77-7) TaxID=1071380 RepID=I2GY23_HENB6|nr:hypothetical protein TBLA_0B01810 [Tetrapisispora blattae CBS 6284]CCH59025.1 hypothetical protein TBLA_0B01810 [Tetrapisispora blattae CBS 6284]
MPSNSKNKKRKSKSKHNAKKNGSNDSSSAMTPHLAAAEIFDNDTDYPTSRVIKRAPNGDVIVESLHVEQQSGHGHHSSLNPQDLANDKDIISVSNDVSVSNGRTTNGGSMALELDSHWESLSPDEKKKILRIEKDEIFDVIKKYQNKHTCNCSICGRRYLAMDQEMERIYNNLLALHKQTDPNLTPVKFHLSIIKELQKSKSQDISFNPIRNPNDYEEDHDNNSIEDNSRDIKHDNNGDYNGLLRIGNRQHAVDSLRKEILHFKESKQKQVLQNNTNQHINGNESIHTNNNLEQPNNVSKQNGVSNNNNNNNTATTITTPNATTTASTTTTTTNNNNNNSNNNNNNNNNNNSNSNGNSNVNSNSSDPLTLNNLNEEISRQKYLEFAENFISSHPKIAEEYVSRLMEFPEMRNLTDNLINHKNRNFLNSLESYLLQNQNFDSLNDSIDTLTSNNDSSTSALNSTFEADTANKLREILNSNNPLTPEQYANLLRHVAIKVIDSYDTTSQAFRKLPPLEHELFSRFISGESKEIFSDILMETFKKKFSDNYETAVTGISIAAAAATERNHPIISEDIDEYEEDDDNDEDEDDEDENEYVEGIEYHHGNDNEKHISRNLKLLSESTSHINDSGNNSEQHTTNSNRNSISEYNKIKNLKNNSKDNINEEVENDEDFHSMQHHHSHDHEHEHSDSFEDIADEDDDDDDLEDADEIDDDEDYDSGIDETERLEEGRKLIQIAITKLLQARIIESYHEKEAENNRLKLLEELEAEDKKKKVKEEKKQKKREKEKERKRLQQVAKEEEKRKKEEERIRSELEAQEREMKRREAQRKKVEENKKKKDEEKRRKLEEQRRREEEQERQRKLKEEQKRKRDEERRQREEEQKRKQEEKLRRKQEEENKRLQKEKEEKEKLLKKQKELEEEKLLKKKKEQERLAKFKKDEEAKKKKQQAEKETSQQLKKDEQNLKKNDTKPHNVKSKVPYTASGLDSMTKSINDDLFDIINSVTTSNAAASNQSTSNLHNLMNFNEKKELLSMAEQPSIPHGINPQPMLASNNTPYSADSNNQIPFGFYDSHSNLSYDMSMANPLNTSIQSAPSNLPLTNSISNSWSGVNLNQLNPITTTTSSQLGQHSSPQTSSQPFNVSFSNELRKQSFVHELDNLTNSFRASNLGDTINALHPTPHINSTPLWEGKRENISTPNPLIDNSGLGINDNPISLGNSLGFQSRPRVSTASIWDTTVSNEHSLNTAENNNISNINRTNSVGNLTTSTGNFAPSNIWNNSSNLSSVPPNNMTTTNSTMVNNGPYTSTVWGNSNSLDGSNSNQITDPVGDIIYRTVLLLTGQEMPGGYVPLDKLFQNCLHLGLDYNSFIIKLTSVSQKYMFEFLRSDTGNITRVRIKMPEQSDLSQPNSQIHSQPQSHTNSQSIHPDQSQRLPISSSTNPNIANSFSEFKDVYLNQTQQGQSQGGNNSIFPNDISPSTRGGSITGSQFMDINRSVNTSTAHSSVMGNIWS